ncbi:Transposon Ty3-I Gag-Pol polyprotein [Amphibalanus amphitrite]|uniref:RNA-directed DNA polymerase n=1 Tax=Amphibalanus amphitrite TaxID=1232801 RepID=A0A6A4WYK6_AMPAM|nr:Transposon Ty3-I Gag-Pol polyprotein [Amphibalanus amphitrite]
MPDERQELEVAQEAAVAGAVQPATTAAAGTQQNNTSWLGRAAQPDRLDLSTDRGDAFRSWKERWDDFYLLAGIASMQPNAQMAALRSCLTDDTNRVVRNLPLTPEERQDVNAVLAQLETYAIGQVNEVLERKRFNSRVQGNRRVTVDALPDTGADLSVGGEDLLAQLGASREDLRRPVHHPRAANGSVIPSVGILPVTIALGDIQAEEEVHILPGVRGLLLSWEVTRTLKLIPADYPRQIAAVGKPESTTAATAERRLSSGPDPTAGVGHCTPTANPSTTADLAGPLTPPPAGGLENAQDPTSIQRPAGSDHSPESREYTDRYRLMSEFERVFDGHIRTMPGEKFTIHLQQDARPFCVTTPRRIPLSLREPLKAELDRLEAEGVICRVTAPTEWCAPIVVTPKKGGAGVRLCVDLSQLNKFVRRERYQSPTPIEEVASIRSSEARWFTVFDALKGYHQCPLAEDSRLLTTFITPFGRFAFLRAPYGVTSISEHYNRRMDEAFEGLSGFRKVVDDVIIFSRTRSEHLQHVRQFLQRCQDRGVSLNASKLQLAQQTVKFAGFIVSGDGYRPDPQLTEALSQFPTPSNLTEVRSFFGLVNQVAYFVDDVAELLTPLRSLLSSRREFIWDENHQLAFDKAKAALTSLPTLAFYDPKLPTRLETDASRARGLGFVLRQAHPDGTWRVIQAGSRFLSDAETRYAVIELEALSVAWAVRKCHIFLSGLPLFQILTDHRPLVPILNSKMMDEIENPRLQRLRMKIGEAGVFTASWRAGAEHVAPDALSRAPVQDPEPGDEVGEDAASLRVCAVVVAELHASGTDVRLDEVRRAALYDPEYQSLKRTIEEGFPQTKNDTPESIRRYWTVRDRLSVDDGLVVCGCRLVIPQELRKAVLAALHDGHLGKERTKSRARQVVYWPGMDADVENVTRSCRNCQAQLPSQQRETVLHHQPTQRPFQSLDLDFAEHAGRKYLIAVDGFSGWRFIKLLGNCAQSKQLMSAMREIFCQVGVPQWIMSDGGPQFASKAFQDFLCRWGVEHRRSSPHYPQSNGRAEAAVKAAKKLIRCCWDDCRNQLDEERWTRGILQHRNTPGRGGRSPAQIVFGHPVRDTLPAHRRSFAPEWQIAADAAAGRLSEQQQRADDLYNRQARDLEPLAVGNQVSVQDDRTGRWDRYGVVCEVGPHRRYFVRLSSGRVLTRNRRHLRRRYGHAIPDELAQCVPPVVSRPPPVLQQREPAAAAPSAPLGLRRSTRVRRRVKRLIEEM